MAPFWPCPVFSAAKQDILLMVSEALSLGLLAEALSSESHACQLDHFQK